MLTGDQAYIYSKKVRQYLIDNFDIKIEDIVDVFAAGFYSEAALQGVEHIQWETDDGSIEMVAALNDSDADEEEEVELSIDEDDDDDDDDDPNAFLRRVHGNF